MTGDDARPSRRTARVNRDSDGVPVGVALMLGVDDLELLGVELDGVDNVEYSVNNEGVHIVSEAEGEKRTGDLPVVDDD